MYNYGKYTQKPILEQIHQSIVNLEPVFYLKNNYRSEEYPWAGIISATNFMVQSTYQTTLQITPIQLF